MVAPSFDPTHAVHFDVPHGVVRAGSDGDRLLLVPVAALNELVRSTPPEAVEALGGALGSSLGRRAAARLGGPQDASIETFVTQLAGEAAVCGVGAWSIERWGRALVVRLDESPLVTTLLSPLVASAIEAATGRRVWSTLLSCDEHVARVFVGSEGGVRRLRDWQASGMGWAAALARLQGAAS